MCCDTEELFSQRLHIWVDYASASDTLIVLVIQTLSREF